MNQALLSLPYLASAITGILAGTIFIAYRRPHFFRYNYYLGIAFIFIALGSLVGFIYMSDLIYQMPHVYRLGTLFVYIAFPFTFIYIQKSVYGKSNTLLNLLLFIPALFYAVDFYPFFIMSGAEKVEILEVSKRTGSDMAFSEGWITPPWIHIYLRQFFIFLIWMLQLNILLRIPRAAQSSNKKWVGWIWMYQLNHACYWLPTLIFIWFDFSTGLRMSTAGIPLIFFFLLHLFLFFNPTILYGRKFAPSDIPTKATREPSEPSNNLPEDRIPEILDKLNLTLRTTKPYLAQGYSLHNLANDVNESPRIVSGILNTKLDTNFNEYINQFRIEHCQMLIEKGEHKTKTIEALGYECGFSNRTSFIKAFKKNTDATPSAYIKGRNTASV